MSSRPWMPLYITDFELDTLELNTTEIGVYMVMLCLAWRRDGPLPGDHKTLKCMLKRCFKEFHGHTYNAVVPKLLEKYFYRDDQGNWRQKRVEKELQNSRKATLNAIQTNGKRWSKTTGFETFQYVSEATATPRARVLQSQLHKESFNGVRDRETTKLVFVKEETEQWNAWTKFYRTSKRPSPGAISRKGTNERGWYFPSEWPPQMTSNES